MRIVMKCCIVTVYNSPNCGSFLQAYALGKALDSIGVSVCYYRIPNNEFPRFVKNTLRAIIKLDFKGLKNLIYQNKRFMDACSLFRVTENKYMPVYILGSDTIWDIRNSRFYEMHDIFWGNVFNNSSIISYAPSIGAAEEQDFVNSAWVSGALNRMSAVSVRENEAKDMLQKYTGKEIQVICDPTLLLSENEYDAITKNVGMDCIFLYYYGKVSAECRKALIDIADSYHLKIISFGNSNSWVDRTEPYDPIRFLELYRSARYIITNTFHGTVFAHIYHKRFAVIGTRKKKINDFLSRMGTSDKTAESASQIDGILHSDFNFSEIDNRIQTEKETGLAYLKNSLRAVENAKFPT